MEPIKQMCHEYVGETVCLHLRDGRTIHGVIREVRDDGIMFFPMNIEACSLRSTKKPRVKPVIFFSPFFFFPFVDIVFVSVIF